MTNHSLAERFNAIKNKVSRFEHRYQRQADEVRLIAVSKTRSVEDIRALAALGQSHFGENYVQESVDKIAKITDIPLVWHFIGPIQKNKTRLIAEHFHWVHSIDREVVATRLSQQRPASLPPLNVCLQVNVDSEASKSGVAAEQVFELAAQIEQLPQLTLRGLMALPKPTQDAQQQATAFEQMALLFTKLQQYHAHIDTLSMGMSNDFEAAIAHGSTMVRIGTALFGPRNNR